VSLRTAHTAQAGDAQMPARIGPYEIMGVLGRGASATIYLGRELFPARDVAIKVYDAGLLASEERAIFRSLFLKETLLAKKLTHPNVTQVYDAAADDERAYIVMEYVQAGSLERHCVPEGCCRPSAWPSSSRRCATRSRTRTRTASSTAT
jgi:serine/threonine protein kinase